MSSTQWGVPTRASSPVKWDDIQENSDAEAPILWPPDVKSQLTGKDPDIGKDQGLEKTVIEGEMVQSFPRP